MLSDNALQLLSLFYLFESAGFPFLSQFERTENKGPVSLHAKQKSGLNYSEGAFELLTYS